MRKILETEVMWAALVPAAAIRNCSALRPWAILMVTVDERGPTPGSSAAGIALRSVTWMMRWHTVVTMFSVAAACP